MAGVIIRLILKGALKKSGKPRPGKPSADKLKKGKADADKKTRDKDSDCTECKKAAPCAALANGSEGGAHGFMKGPANDGKDSHHIPAKSASPLPHDLGPAIRMDPADHRRTASHGYGAAAQHYQRAQKRLIQQGKFRQAFAMDVADIKSKFGDKYDKGISQATAYMECLKRTKVVK